MFNQTKAEKQSGFNQGMMSHIHQQRGNDAGLVIDVRLSWLVKRRNAYRFTGSDAVLDWGIYDLDKVTMQPTGGDRTVTRVPNSPSSFNGLAKHVLEDFLTAAHNGSAPVAGPSDVLPSLELLEGCYGRRARFDLPWETFRQGQAHG